MNRTLGFAVLLGVVLLGNIAVFLFASLVAWIGLNGLTDTSVEENRRAGIYFLILAICAFSNFVLLCASGRLSINAYHRRIGIAVAVLVNMGPIGLGLYGIYRSTGDIASIDDLWFAISVIGLGIISLICICSTLRARSGHSVGSA